MADEEKHHVVRTLKREYDENASKLRQARPGWSQIGLGAAWQCSCTAIAAAAAATAAAVGCQGDGCASTLACSL